MDWNSQNSPSETGSYLVSVMLPRQHGVSVFKYIAHYDADKDRWYKFDPFDDSIGDVISGASGNVTAWAENTSVFIK